MLIRFEVATVPAEFRRNSMTGRAELTVGRETLNIASPWRPSTQFQLRRTKSYSCRIDGHNIEIVKRRPQFMAGFRKNSFTVLVDGEIVAEAHGR